MAREVINGCAYEGRPASRSTWVCFSWPQAPQPGRTYVCVFGLIHFFAAAALPSSRPPKPNFHISFFVCGSPQHVNPPFKRIWVFFSWFQCIRLFIVFVHFQFTKVNTFKFMLPHLHLIILWCCTRHQTLLLPTWLGVCVPVELPAERALLFACFICRKNNVRNALTCHWRWYHSIAAAVLPRPLLFRWFKVWNMTPVQSTVWARHHMVWTLKSNLILSQTALATRRGLIIQTTVTPA